MLSEPNDPGTGSRRFLADSTLPLDLKPLIAHSGAPANPFNWEQVARVLRKNWRLGGTCALATFAIFLAYAMWLKDSYQPFARLEIDPPGSGALSQRETESSMENNQEYLETQAQILQSDELATRVVRAMRLDRETEIVGKTNLAKYRNLKSLSPSVTPRLAPDSPLQEQFAAANRTPLETIALRTFHRNLSVNTVRGSRLLEVSFSSHDPALAQGVVNNLVAAFIDENFKTRYQSTMQASEWLSSQLNDLRQKVESSKQAVVDYQKRYNLVDEDDKDGPSMKLAADVGHQVSEATADRIQVEAFMRMIDTGQATSLPQVQASPVYQTLTAQYAEANAKLAQAKVVYGEENAAYKKLENEVKELALQREAEQDRIALEIRTAYQAAREREQLMLASMARLKTEMGNTNERLVRYRILSNEARANADTYNTLLMRLKEAGVYAGLRSSNIRVVDPASLLDRPTEPHRFLLAALGVVVAVIVAFLAVFGRESFDNTVCTPDDISDWIGLRSLAIMPLIPSTAVVKRPLILDAPKGSEARFMATVPENDEGTPRLLSTQQNSREAEALRELRTSLLLPGGKIQPRVFLVTSPVAGEGKSTVAINTAVALSQRGETCLMDCDLRRRSITHAFGCSRKTGWTSVSFGDTPLENALSRVEGFNNLFLLPVGSDPDLPPKFNSPDKMNEFVAGLRTRFDYVVIDSPPVIPFSDARVLAQFADAVILVGKYGLTTKRALVRCAQRLQEVGASLAGVVINGMDFSSPDYVYYNYGYSSGKLQKYGYYSDESPAVSPENPPAPTDKAKGASA